MDIGFAMSVLTQNLARPKPTHFILAKKVLAYLHGTKSLGLILGGEVSSDLCAFLMQVLRTTLKIEKAWEGILSSYN